MPQMPQRAARIGYSRSIDRHRALPEGLEFDKEDEDHWIIIVNRRMQKDELLLKLIALAREWRALGRFQRDE